MIKQQAFVRILAIFFFTANPVTSNSGRGQNQDNNPPLAITVQLPTLGVSIDAAGVLTTSVYADPDGQLIRDRLEAARRDLTPQLQTKSRLRKVSLRRLEQAISESVEAGHELSDELKSLAGLTRIEFVFILPDQNDIVLAGPAEPWIQNLAGHAVGIHTGEPTLLLEDLIVAIRTFAPARPLNSWVACSIDPTAEGLAGLQDFQQRLPDQVAEQSRDEAALQLAGDLRNSLGMADVKVYGIAPRSHAAHVMIEADYRMKMMAVGLEIPPVRMTTFIGALKGAPRHLQRWWLTPNYKCLIQSDDGLSVRLIGRGVQLQTENIDLGQRARVAQQPNKPSRAARLYAASFTKNYEQLSALSPVYAQLRNLIDLLVAAAWIRKINGYEQANWRPEIVLDESKYTVSRLPGIKHAQCVANAVWKQNILILPAGGGVSILASDALKKENLGPDSDGAVLKMADSITIPQAESWWWD